jgi:stearoyl-CoA desaturase (delta-9 desaturase)
MRYFASSAYTLTSIQIITTLLTIAGFFYFDFTANNLLMFFIFYFLYSGIGVSMMMHRYWTHHSFEFKYSIIKWLFTWFALMAGRGSVLGWVYVHREHHKYSDSENDPHAPKHARWRVFFPHMLGYGKTINKFLIKDLMTPLQLKINQYYVLLILLWILFLSLFGLDVLYFYWIMPVAVTQLVLNSFIYFGHTHGYRNHDLKDDSKNLWIYSILFWGEGWHNNHHKNPGNWNNQTKWWEIDPIAWVIRMVKT